MTTASPTSTSSPTPRGPAARTPAPRRPPGGRAAGAAPAPGPPGPGAPATTRPRRTTRPATTRTTAPQPRPTEMQPPAGTSGIEALRKRALSRSSSFGSIGIIVPLQKAVKPLAGTGQAHLQCVARGAQDVSDLCQLQLLEVIQMHEGTVRFRQVSHGV